VPVLPGHHPQEATISESTDNEPADNGTQAGEGPKRKRFVRHVAPKLAADEVARQGRIAQLAWSALGRDEALALLNSHSDALGGRPLDIATDSVAGFAQVERLIRDRAEAV
jgi:hypothetical protein